jgi:pimeloyl-ACP methyl ester carboxylesterase
MQPQFAVLLAVTLLAAFGGRLAHAQARIGVVLMHGKQSAPAEHAPLADALARAGYLVETPEMCWSARRIYDRPYLQCLRDIDAALQRLQQRGATAFVVAGHSLGANGALAYGARHRIAGVAALAPGHRPELLALRPPIAAALVEARRLIAEGRGTNARPFPDFNGDLVIAVTATPETYLSFFSADSPAGMPDNAARLRMPLLSVVGSADPLQRGPGEIFAKAPAHPLNRYVTVRAGHFDTSAAAADAMIGWLRAVAADQQAR